MLASKKLKMVKTMNIAICDDEFAFTSIFVNYINQYAARHNLNNSVLTYHSGAQLLMADLSCVDVLFLDIDMPDFNGIDTAYQLRKRYSDLILVFVTGLIEYAPEGYRVNAYRYLLKKNLPEELWHCMDEIQQKLFEENESISLHDKQLDIFFDIQLKKIIYFEGTRTNTVILHSKNVTSSKECAGSLLNLEKRLTPSGFIRIQKSFLVNMAWIEKIRNYQVFLRNGEVLKASERKYRQITQQYLIWRGSKI